MYHARYNMAGRQFEIVVRPIDVARHDRRENVLMLVVVCTVCNVNQPLCIAIAEIGVMRWSIVNLIEIGRQQKVKIEFVENLE